MAKRQNPASPPPVGLPTPRAVDAEPQPQPQPQAVASESIERTVTIAVPLVPTAAAGYVPHRFHLEVQLDRKTAVAFCQLQTALDRRHARLAAGKIVQSRADVCRWLLEQIATPVEGTHEA